MTTLPLNKVPSDYLGSSVWYYMVIHGILRTPTMYPINKLLFAGPYAAPQASNIPIKG